MLTKEEGGRHTPFPKGYQPQFFFRTTDVTGAIVPPEGTDRVMPGETAAVTVELPPYFGSPSSTGRVIADGCDLSK